jgi:hypothetical protein
VRSYLHTHCRDDGMLSPAFHEMPRSMYSYKVTQITLTIITMDSDFRSPKNVFVRLHAPRVTTRQCIRTDLQLLTAAHF